MATIIVNGCFDVLHEGHVSFLRAARGLGYSHESSLKNWPNRLIACVNSDRSAKKIKGKKWGKKYPIQPQLERMEAVARYADEVVGFDSEEQLVEFIEFNMPCILVKGPDYAGKVVTGDQIAPVIILDTPEPESAKKMKIQVYGQLPNAACTSGIPSDQESAQTSDNHMPPVGKP